MPLRIGIDLTARLPVATGVDTYLENLVTALAKVDRENFYTLWVNLEDRAALMSLLGQAEAGFQFPWLICR